MNPLVSLLFLVLRLSSATAVPATDGTCQSVAGVDHTCKAIVGTNPGVDHDFCLAALKADPASASADAQGLAVIAARLAVSEAAESESKIHELMDLKDTDEHERRVLRRCREEYREALDRLGDALDNLRSGLYDDAAVLMEKAMGAAEKCEEEFYRAKLEGGSPLASEDRNYGKMARIAMAIAKSVE